MNTTVYFDGKKTDGQSFFDSTDYVANKATIAVAGERVPEPNATYVFSTWNNALKWSLNTSLRNNFQRIDRTMKFFHERESTDGFIDKYMEGICKIISQQRELRSLAFEKSDGNDILDGHIVVYEDVGYQGDWTGVPGPMPKLYIPILLNWDDQISACRAFGNVTFFEHEVFKGRAYHLDGVNEVPDFRDTKVGNFNDITSSITPF